MKKLQAVMLALVAVFALGAVVAESASAENWLAGASKTVITSSLASETTGSLKLEDTKTLIGKASVICSAVLDGTVGATGSDEITKVLRTNGEEVGTLGGTALLCTAGSGCAAATEASPIEVWPIGLPWKTQLVVSGSEVLDKVSATSFGYELLCLILGVNTEDTCTAAEESIKVANNASGDASTPSGSLATPNATCTQSKEATGVNEASGEALIKLTSGELLSIE